MKPTYEVLATRYEQWWGLTVPDVAGAVSQVRRLTQADEYAREAVAFVLGVDPDSFEVTLRVELPEDLRAAVAEARDRVAELEWSQRKAAEQSRDVARRLRAAGLSGVETATVLGVSPQRVSQLTSSP